MKKYYCWRCKCDIPVLEESEWERMAPALSHQIERIKRIRQERDCDLATAKRMVGQEACDMYFEMTGHRETNFNAIWHHRLATYGSECPRCGHLFRTPNASYCANCGFKGESNGRIGRVEAV
jgi:hypothetical protein